MSKARNFEVSSEIKDRIQIGKLVKIKEHDKMYLPTRSRRSTRNNIRFGNVAF